jgi:hypothetical protein
VHITLLIITLKFSLINNKRTNILEKLEDIKGAGMAAIHTSVWDPLY